MGSTIPFMVYPYCGNRKKKSIMITEHIIEGLLFEIQRIKQKLRKIVYEFIYT